MEHPISQIGRHKLDVARLRYTHEHGVSRSPSGLWLSSSFRAGDDESVPVKMNRMVIHSEIDQTNPDSIPVADDERRGCWSSLAVEGEHISFRRNDHAIAILHFAGLPVGPSTVATVLAAAVGSLLMAYSALAFLDPLDEGGIAWRGVHVRGSAVPRYRRQVVYLHQRPALFDGSVEHHLAVPFRLAAHRGTLFPRERMRRDDGAGKDDADNDMPAHIVSSPYLDGFGDPTPLQPPKRVNSER